MKCPSCQTIRHLLNVCLDSYKNLRQFLNTVLAAVEIEEPDKEAYFTDNLNESIMKVEGEGEAYDMILFTRGKQKITGLGGQMLGSLLLDCG